MLAWHSGCYQAKRGRFFRSGITALPFNEGHLAPTHAYAWFEMAEAAGVEA